MDQKQATQKETLAYIEELLEELVKLAKTTDSNLLVYMIDMALQEARDSVSACGARNTHKME
ncbi:hypothetical protein DKP76_05490 [Falsochrobactrum shanghaiense]|uniref:Uncharacterized protein n=1 Tax=Falsochrobactrum shanghaiense TaxID=2201899 RepID=A0A316JCY7_9HYPH|nr:hypothetical protein [Falsochrobactrum shanghaiense]PWL18545.1 hypothetical protein DKP76_05490 [Falsochrobactrum shanghaiense]